MRVITPYTLILWLIYAALLLLCLRRTRQMPFLATYLAFSGVRTLILMGVAIAASPTRYWAFYWPLQGIGYIVAACLALSLILSVTRDPRRRLDLMWAIALVVFLPFLVAFYADSWHSWLTAARWCDITVMWGLLYSHVWMRDRWQQPQEDLAMGLIVGMAGHAFCGLIQGDHDPAQWLRVLYQLAGIAQLTIWSLALGTGRCLPRWPTPLRSAGAGSG